MPQSRIRELAGKILDNTAEIESKLEDHGVPLPSFSTDYTQANLEKCDIARPRNLVLEAVDELHALLLGPIGQLTSHSHEISLTLQSLYRFDIASKVPIPEKDASTIPTATFSEIARRSGLTEPLVKRFLRHAMTYHIFCEPVEGRVAHTAASKTMATDEGLRNWVGLVEEDMWGAAAKTVDAISKWPQSSAPNHSGFNLFHSTTLPVFEFFSSPSASTPAMQARYATAMSWFGSMPALSPQHIVTGFPWVSSTAPGTTVVDVGGGEGGVMSVAVARAVEDVTFIVQDLPEVVAGGQMRVPSDLSERVKFMAHDIFCAQPIDSNVGDEKVSNNATSAHLERVTVYLLRWILHDWSDEYAIRILRALCPALDRRRGQAKLCIAEIVLPSSSSLINGSDMLEQRQLRSMDLAMLGFHNGKERDLGEWKALLEQADPRFDIKAVRQPEGSLLSCIEVGWQMSSR